MTTGIREQKAAKLKVLILRTTLDLIGKKPFKDLYVDEICSKVKISKVTFFKYFPQKEDILLYYYRVQCLDCIIELGESRKTGLEAVRYIFDKLVQAYHKYPGMLMSFISYATSLDRPPAPFPIKPMERQLIFNGKDDVTHYDLLSLPQLLEKHLLEAVFEGKINSADTKELTHTFMSMFYGTVLTAHLRQVESMQLLMNRNLSLLVKSLSS